MKVIISSNYLCIVTMTENGKLAFEILKDDNKEWDLVLLDLYMPEMDGFELLSLIQEDERLRFIPVVVMTSNDTNELAANYLSKSGVIFNLIEMGARDFLVKPIRFI